jgi:hypothetical protein
MDVNGEYGSASSTVGGRKGRPPPLALCQFPFWYPDMVEVVGRLYSSVCRKKCTTKNFLELPE